MRRRTPRRRPQQSLSGRGLAQAEYVPQVYCPPAPVHARGEGREGDAGRIVMGASRQVGRSFRVGGVLWGSAIAIATGGRLAVSSLRCPVSESRPRPSRLRGLVLRIVGFRRRSPAPPWPARLRGSAEFSAAGRAVPVLLFLGRIPPGLSAGVGTGGRQQSRENQKERARRGGSECA